MPADVVHDPSPVGMTPEPGGARGTTPTRPRPLASPRLVPRVVPSTTLGPAAQRIQGLFSVPPLLSCRSGRDVIMYTDRALARHVARLSSKLVSSAVNADSKHDIRFVWLPDGRRGRYGLILPPRAAPLHHRSTRSGVGLGLPARRKGRGHASDARTRRAKRGCQTARLADLSVDDR